MGITKELQQFRSGEPDEILARMAAMRDQQDGRSWLNLQPWVDQEKMPKVSLWRHVFSNRGFSVPTGTWIPGSPASSPVGTTEVGFVHGSGFEAVARLDEEGVVFPDGYRVVQDHTKRGLVVHFADPDAVELSTMLEWMIATERVLAGDIPTDDRWVAGFLTRE